MAVAAAQSVAAAHSAMAAARWQQHGGCSRFADTVRKCNNACAFKRHQRANVRIFVLGQGRKDDSANGIIVVGSNGGARGDFHCGRQCPAATADADADNDNTANANAASNADNIVC